MRSRSCEELPGFARNTRDPRMFCKLLRQRITRHEVPGSWLSVHWYGYPCLCEHKRTRVSRKRAAKLSPPAVRCAFFFFILSKSSSLLLWPEKNMKFQKRKPAGENEKLWKICAYASVGGGAPEGSHAVLEGKWRFSIMVLFSFSHPPVTSAKGRVEIKMIFNLTRLRASICLWPSVSGSPRVRFSGYQAIRLSRWEL